MFAQPRSTKINILKRKDNVRTASEYAQGHVVNSKNIPLNEIGENVELIKTWSKPVITVCRSGNRSAMAQTLLTTAGIEAYNGGAWTNLQRNEYQKRNLK
jgi:rhodanese-related sulfurtransferase